MLERTSIHLQIDKDGKTNLSEEDLLTVAQPSSCGWREVFRVVCMPKAVRGLKVLDVGGGASDATCRLLEMGADAYAIDPAYQRMSRLKESVKSANRYFSKDAETARDGALKRFKQSTKTHKSRYKGASATDIPFPDNYFDIVFSRIAVLVYLDIDKEILARAVDECLRVTKPGGTIRLFPFGEALPFWPEELNERRMINNQLMFEELQKTGSVKQVLMRNVVDNGVESLLLIIDKAD